jgi:membrane fusion protein, peptide pheromone/bacteriocin exporter
MLLTYAELKDTVEWWLPPMRRSGFAIYWLMIGLLFSALISLFFLRINIVVRAPGVIRPLSETADIKSNVSGTIDSIYCAEGTLVQKKQILFVIRDPALLGKMSQNKKDIQARKDFVFDLQILTSSVRISRHILRYLHTPLYFQQALHYLSRNREQQLILSKADHEMEINAQLEKNKVISRKEFYDVSIQQQKSMAAYESFCREQTAVWQEDLLKYKNELEQLFLQEKELEQVFEANHIRSPVTGFVQEINNRYAGSSTQPGEIICSVSPSGKIIAECFVFTKDIGMLKSGQRARFLIDAFDYNNFGAAAGRIVSIDNDYSLLEKIPVYKVRCRLDKEHLDLKNGFHGEIKKGMTVQARFFVASRTPWQILYDKVDNWLNPTR